MAHRKLFLFLSLFLLQTDGRGALIKSWIVVPNEGSGNIVIIDSKTEAVETVDIETGHPAYVNSDGYRHEFYVRDHETIFIYDSVTLERLEVIHTDCHGRFWQWHNEETHQLWNVCDANRTVMVFDVQSRKAIATISVDFFPHAVVALEDRAFRNSWNFSWKMSFFLDHFSFFLELFLKAKKCLKNKWNMHVTIHMTPHSTHTYWLVRIFTVKSVFIVI